MVTLKPITEILDLGSSDYWHMRIEDALDRIRIDDDYHQRLKKKMRCDGYSKVPVHISDGYRELENGHHRVKIAAELGWLFLESDTKFDSRNNQQTIL